MRPDQAPDRRPVWDHLGLVAGMCDELGSGDVIAQAPPHHPALRDRPVGSAGQALGLNGLGCIPPALCRVHRCFPQTPPSRRMSPRLGPEQLNDDARGRALETL